VVADGAEHILAFIAPSCEQALGHEVFGSVIDSLATADLLLDLERTYIALGLIVADRTASSRAEWGTAALCHCRLGNVSVGHHGWCHK